MPDSKPEIVTAVLIYVHKVSRFNPLHSTVPTNGLMFEITAETSFRFYNINIIVINVFTRLKYNNAIVQYLNKYNNDVGRLKEFRKKFSKAETLIIHVN